MDKKKFAFFYGIILIAVGLGVIYRIPEVMLKVEEIEFFAKKLLLLKICFYILAGMLMIAGGIRIFKSHKS
ncbi:MAG: hypothetical protein GY729_19665 [Desulfobacteraceae bacterium]|nr:hypothetical protein [Desulfobacteraceae bacterium]